MIFFGESEIAVIVRRHTHNSAITKGDDAIKAGRAKDASSVSLPAVVEDYFCATRQPDLVQAAALIVGLHCDGAVNAIIRAACIHRKSFAIVACCVFSREYPRVLNDGTGVTSREHLNAWILEECVRQGFEGTTGLTTLPFDGANVCAYGICR